MAKDKEELFTYNTRITDKYTKLLHGLIEDVAIYENIPKQVVITSVVLPVLPVFCSIPLFFQILTEITLNGGFESFSSSLLKHLQDRNIVRRSFNQMLLTNREVLYVIGKTFKPKVNNTKLFTNTLQFMYNLRNSNSTYLNAYNSIIIEYYLDKRRFLDTVTICLEEKKDLELVSHSLRNLLDLESQATNIKYLHRLYLLVEQKRTGKRKDISYLLDLYDRLNLMIDD